MHSAYRRGLMAAGILAALFDWTGGAAQGQGPPASPRLLIEAGRYAEAEALAREMLAETEGAHGTDSVEAAEVLDVLVESLWRGGKAQEPDTMTFAQRALAIREQKLGPDHVDLAGSLSNLGSLHYHRGNPGAARVPWERAVAIAEASLGSDHPRLAGALGNLALALMAAGDYTGARPLYKRAIAIKERALGPDHQDLAGDLNNLAVLLRQSGDYEAARPLLQRSVAISERSFGPDHPNVAKSLGGLADLLHVMGEYGEAEPLYERAIAIQEGALGPDHPALAGDLNNFSVLLRKTGNYSRAKALAERALAIKEKVHGPDHPRLGSSLESIAKILTAMGDYAAAQPLFERSLAIQERALGLEHPRVARTLQGLAANLQTRGDYVGARNLMERALAIYEKTFGPDHLHTAGLLHNLALLHHNLGDWGEARRLFERAAAAFEKALGPDHLDLAMTLESLAHVLRRTGDAAGARRLHERALAAREKTLGPDHPDVAFSLHNMALVDLDAGDLARAKPLFERALSIWERRFGPDHPDIAMSLEGLARVLSKSGDYERAVMLHQRALAIREKAYGPGHPIVAYSLYNLAADLRESEPLRALDLALRTEELGREHVRLTAGTLTEREALHYAATRTSCLDLALSIAVSGPEGAPDAGWRAWDVLIRSRALVLDEMAARHRTVSAVADPEISRLSEGLGSARQQLANLLVRGPGDASPERYGALLDEARAAREKAGRALAERSLSFREGMTRAGLGLKEVALSLPSKSVLVTYARYERQVGERGTRASIPSYLALVLRQGEKDAILLPLGPAEEIERLVSRWRDELGPGAVASRHRPAEAAYGEAGRALRRGIWDPIEAHLAESDLVFVVPDGALHLVSLAALPTHGGRYLLEEGPLVHYLSAERDLVPLSGWDDRGEGLLAMGDPAFDETDLFAALAPRRKESEGSAPGGQLANLFPFGGARSACGDFHDLRFAPLPAARREVREIVSIWKRRASRAGDGMATVKRMGAEASEAALKEDGPGKRVLHLATHGFFLGGRCASALDSGRGIAGMTVAGDQESPPVTGENPLLLSGLALAGANHREAAGPGEEDGILTAEEIAALRRAFQVAGARTLIMSLWSVKDEATREWMKALYEARLEKGLDTAESVRDASLTVLGRRREAGESTHPFYWGAFVAAGDWR